MEKNRQNTIPNDSIGETKRECIGWIHPLFGFVDTLLLSGEAFSARSAVYAKSSSHQE